MDEDPTDSETTQSPQLEPTPAELQQAVDDARRELEQAEAEVAKLQGTQRDRKNCDANVEPIGKGMCPGCGHFLPGHTVSLIHGGRRMNLPPPFKSRRAELKKQVWADLGGHLSPIEAEVADDFVSACVLRDQLVEHLEAIGPLTQRGARRAAMDLYLATSARIERLSAMVAAYKAGKPAQPTAFPGAGQMALASIEHYRELLRRAASGESLSDFERGELEALRSAAQGHVPPVSQPGNTGAAASPLPRNDEIDRRATISPAPDPSVAPN